MQFYGEVFGWKFQDASGYFVAMQGGTEIAGLYQTPEFFQKIRMPHFWMSYIVVADALATAEVAKEFADAKVELTDDFYGGKIALIRDPQGAGFTVYDGNKLNGRGNQTGQLVWNELHVSDASTVVPFYEKLFNWTISKSSDASYQIHDSNQNHISDILVLPNELKGKYEYWACTFAVDNLNSAKDRVIDNGGGVVYEEAHRIMLHDDSEEAFFFMQQ